MHEKFIKIIKIFKIILIVFVILTAIVFWIENVLDFFVDDLGFSDWSDEGLPCYTQGDIATIEIKGEIVPYFVYSSPSDNSDLESSDAVSAEEVDECVNKIQKDKEVRGIIVEINSPGGSPVASEEIMKSIKRLTKPNAAVIREGAISGAYLIATAAEKIFASELSDIGGIGVTSSYLDYSQQDKNEGIIYQELSSAKFKDTGDPDKPLSQEEKALIMRDINLSHDIFVKYVSQNRGLEIEKVKTLADGSTMMGKAAKENNLIDEIGDKWSAADWLYEN